MNLMEDFCDRNSASIYWFQILPRDLKARYEFLVQKMVVNISRVSYLVICYLQA